MKYIKGYEIFESQISAIRQEIPYESFAKKNDRGELDPTKKITGTSKIIDYADRKIVVFDVNGVNVPVRKGKASYSLKADKTGTNFYKVKVNVMNPLTGKITSVEKEFAYEVGE